jgi:hypothetical protein
MTRTEIKLFKRLSPSDKGCVLDGPCRGCCEFGTLRCRIMHPSLWMFLPLEEVLPKESE